MPGEVKQIEIVEINPTHVQIKFLPYGNVVKIGKRFFLKKVDSGFYEVVNKEKIPSVI